MRLALIAFIVAGGFLAKLVRRARDRTESASSRRAQAHRRVPPVPASASKKASTAAATSERLSRPARMNGWRDRTLEILGGITIIVLILLIVVAVWPDLHEEVGAAQAILLIGTPCVLGIFLIVALWQLPKRQIGPRLYELGPGGQLFAENAARLTIAQIVGGLFLFLSVVFGWRQIQATDETVRQAQEGLRLTEEGQITERFTRAVEQLGSDKTEVRLGGIYALERIARDSERDRETSFQVISAFVRGRVPRHIPLGSPTPLPEYSPYAPPPPLPVPPPFPEDAQAAILVLLRDGSISEIQTCWDVSETDLRGASLWASQVVQHDPFVESLLDESQSSEAPSQRRDIRGICLTRSDLSGADLRHADLRGMDLSGVVLTHANLGSSDLTGAFLYQADLSFANLENARLTETRLTQANLTAAVLDGADLRDADINWATLAYARLNGADLTGAILSFADVSHGHLHSAELSCVDFSSADLAEADLSGANLAGADFQAARLTNADLTGANLTGANLWYADLTGASLEGANLQGVDHLTREQLESAVVDGDTILPEVFDDSPELTPGEPPTMSSRCPSSEDVT